MNFIKIQNTFINLNNVKKIEVNRYFPLTMMNKVSEQPTNTVKINYNDDTSDIINVYAETSPENLSEAISEAILSCADADCEDIFEYVDEDEDEEDDW